MVAAFPGVAEMRRAHDLSVDDTARADLAARSLLLELLSTIELSAGALHSKISMERLHALRVAMRRSRALLGACVGVFPEQLRERFERELRWASTSTAPARDLDVLLAGFDSHVARMPAECRSVLESLRRELEREREPARSAVVAALRSERWGRWMDDWRRYLESPVPLQSSLADATRPIRAVAAERVGEALQKVLRRGRRLDAASPAEALHRLRLKVKRLRYLVDAFRGVYDTRGAEDVIQSLKRLQDALGACNDLDVHARMIEARTSGVASTGRSEPLLQAAERLTALLRTEQSAARRRFVESFAAFDHPQQIAAVSALR